jgi:nickel-type superoxide dismutase maturation protease
VIRLRSSLVRRLEALAADRQRLVRLGVDACLLSVGAVVAAAAVTAKHRLLRLEVEGVSMVPVLAPGDRVLVLRTGQVAVGDIIAIHDPEGSEAVWLKRLSGIDRSSLRVEGDNPGASRDSRHFGPIPRSALVGRVLWRYWSPYRPRKAWR